MPSRLAIFDIQDNSTQTVLVDPEIVEAPNWSPDGTFLVVNKTGLIYRVPLESPNLQLIDTAFAARCNNDHGISPDGTRLAISDSTKEGASCIYTLPINGGTPDRVTENVPSYWHGWSPDGKTLTYTARRENTFDIHVISIDGGRETKITNGFDHTDGPDYSRDGQWIWFNADKSGERNLWRVRPNGTDLQQMTDSPSVDWFPHPNPKNDTVLYIAYEAGTEKHPRDLPVTLRLLDPTAGTEKTLYSMIGGQGSINTPCWSPDGTKFAFVETIEI